MTGTLEAAREVPVWAVLDAVAEARQAGALDPGSALGQAAELATALGADVDGLGSPPRTLLEGEQASLRAAAERVATHPADCLDDEEGADPERDLTLRRELLLARHVLEAAL